MSKKVKLTDFGNIKSIKISKPKRYPYVGNKKQSDIQIAKLQNEVTVCTADISALSIKPASIYLKNDIHLQKHNSDEVVSLKHLLKEVSKK